MSLGRKQNISNEAWLKAVVMAAAEKIESAAHFLKEVGA